MSTLWRFDGFCSLVRTASHMYKIFLFFCEWDISSHDMKRDWSLTQSLGPRRKNIQHSPLVEAKGIELHTKIGLMKSFLKATDKE